MKNLLFSFLIILAITAFSFLCFLLGQFFLSHFVFLYIFKILITSILIVVVSSKLLVPLRIKISIKKIVSGTLVAAFGLVGVMVLHFVVLKIIGVSLFEMIRGPQASEFSFFSTQLLISVVLAPIFEEFFYRGFCIELVDRKASKQPIRFVGRSLVIALFVVMHFLPWGVQPTLQSIFVWTCCGILMTVMYDHYKNIWPGVVVHSLANLVLILVANQILFSSF